MAHTLAQFNDAAPQDAAAMLADLYPHAPLAIAGEEFARTASFLGLAVFALVAVLFWRRVMRLA